MIHYTSVQNQLWLLSWLLHPLRGSDSPLASRAGQAWWPLCAPGGWAPRDHYAALWMRVWSAEHLKCDDLSCNPLRHRRMFQIPCAPTEELSTLPGTEYATTAIHARVRFWHGPYLALNVHSHNIRNPDMTQAACKSRAPKMSAWLMRIFLTKYPGK